MLIHEEDFKLIINSDDGQGSNTSQLKYNFDFSQFSNGKYSLTFSFLSNISTALDASEPIDFRVDFGNTNVYQTSTTTSANSVQTIGLIQPTIISTTEGIMKSDFLQNSPVIIHKPLRSQFTVSLYDFDGALWEDSTSSYLARYILVLNFHKI